MSIEQPGPLYFFRIAYQSVAIIISKYAVTYLFVFSGADFETNNGLLLTCRLVGNCGSVFIWYIGVL